MLEAMLREAGKRALEEALRSGSTQLLRDLFSSIPTPALRRLHALIEETLKGRAIDVQATPKGG